MRAAVIVFPGSNCDRDLATALARQSGHETQMIWHKDAELPAGLDLVAIPGGFSFGDYLRCGAIAARSPIMRSVVKFAQGGGHVLGVCNGFQILIESGLLPGALMRNSGLKFVCKELKLKINTTNSPFTNTYNPNAVIRVPIAHHDGNYMADAQVLARLKDEDRIAFTYCDNPNGSMGDIAGILSQNRRVLGMMPHPERLDEADLGGTGGSGVFQSLNAAMSLA